MLGNRFMFEAPFGLTQGDAGKGSLRPLDAHRPRTLQFDLKFDF